MNIEPWEVETKVHSSGVVALLKSLEAPVRRYRYVTRKEWRAAKPGRTRSIIHPVDNVVVNYHWGEQKCMDQESCMEYLQDEQRRLMRQCGEDDIPFHFMIADDGTVYEGRGWHFVSSKNIEHIRAHGYGSNRIDIAYIGNYEDGDRQELIKPVLDLVEHGVFLKYVDKEWHLDEEPWPQEDIEQWPPKRKQPPRLWW